MKKLFQALALFVLPVALHAQCAVVAAGGDASGGEGSFSGSLGQTATLSVGSNGEFLQGVQIPFEILVTGVPEIEGIHLTYKAYPNPTAGNLQLELPQNGQDWSVRLLTQEGRLVFVQKAEAPLTLLDLSQAAPASYVLQVLANGKVVQNFKIIKL